MTNVQIFASELEVGTVLSNGTTVVEVTQNLFSKTTSWITSDGKLHEEWSFQSIALQEQTNCLYGGIAVGHSYGFCTADSCY